MYSESTVIQMVLDKNQAIHLVCGNLCITHPRQREVTSEGMQIK